MSGWAHRDGRLWQVIEPGEPIPQKMINAERREARNELARVLYEGGSTPARVSTLANRVVPAAGGATRQGDGRVDDLVARIEERRAAARTDERGDALEMGA